MKTATKIPVTVKCRLGVDDQDPEEALDALADAAVGAGADAIWVHARKAWLQGLSPKQNREVPPLDYRRVYRLKARLPKIFVGINGGIATLDAVRQAFDRVDGVMLGRAAWQNPALLAEADVFLDGGVPAGRVAAAERMIPYAARHLSEGGRMSAIVRPMLGLFHGEPGARHWRRLLTEGAAQHGADASLIAAALREVAASRRLDKAA
jgi:tRNA-dihydrouridine synthase A